MAMQLDSRIFIAGHRGLVGSAIVRALQYKGFDNLFLQPKTALDLRNQSQVHSFFHEKKPEYVFLAAAKVGGIGANSRYPADFIRDNLLIQTNVIDAAFQAGVKKLLFLGSSCIYPKFSPQPIPEDALLTGDLENSNAAYAIAKIAGISMCQSYAKQYGFQAISLMPTNLYGPEDNFDPESSHVLPALIRKFVEARENNLSVVTLWGSGNPKREFLHVDDLAEAAIFLMGHYEDPSIINVGSGEEISISELAALIAKEAGYHGAISYDTNHLDGTPRKLVDISKISSLGWKPSITLHEGIKKTISWYQAHRKALSETIKRD